MKKILIVLIITITIVTFIFVTFKNKVKMKGSDTKIAYWNFDSKINNKKTFSLADTLDKESIEKGYIAPRF